MTRIDFYLLNTAAPGACERIACRLTDKAYGQGHRVHIHTDSAAASQRMDAILWSFRDRSFIPHAIEPQEDAACPVTIGHGWIPAQCEVLINLAAEVPVFFSRFERVAEIVHGEDAARRRGRERYRLYRDRGYALQHHEITGAP